MERVELTLCTCGFCEEWLHLNLVLAIGEDSPSLGGEGAFVALLSAWGENMEVTKYIFMPSVSTISAWYTRQSADNVEIKI